MLSRIPDKIFQVGRSVRLPVVLLARDPLHGDFKWTDARERVEHFMARSIRQIGCDCVFAHIGAKLRDLAVKPVITRLMAEPWTLIQHPNVGGRAVNVINKLKGKTDAR